MRKTGPLLDAGWRAAVGLLLLAALSFQAFPAPHAGGFHPDEELAVETVDSGCREHHPASFEIRGRDHVGACLACLAHCMGRATPPTAERIAVIPAAARFLCPVPHRKTGTSPSDPPPARGPPSA